MRCRGGPMLAFLVWVVQLQRALARWTVLVSPMSMQSKPKVMIKCLVKALSGATFPRGHTYLCLVAGGQWFQ